MILLPLCRQQFKSLPLRQIYKIYWTICSYFLWWKVYFKVWSVFPETRFGSVEMAWSIYLMEANQYRTLYTIQIMRYKTFNTLFFSWEKKLLYICFIIKPYSVLLSYPQLWLAGGEGVDSIQLLKNYFHGQN